MFGKNKQRSPRLSMRAHQKEVLARANAPAVLALRNSPGISSGEHTRIGQLYWYYPRPKPGDDSCVACSFLFAKDQERRANGEPGLVLPIHLTRAKVSTCPACGETNDLPTEDYVRVKDMSSIVGGFADVNIKWLLIAEEADIVAYFLADEDAVDSRDRPYLDGGRFTLGSQAVLDHPGDEVGGDDDDDDDDGDQA